MRQNVPHHISTTPHQHTPGLAGMEAATCITQQPFADCLAGAVSS